MTHSFHFSMYNTVNRISLLSTRWYSRINQPQQLQIPKEVANPFQNSISKLKAKMSPTIFQKFIAWRDSQKNITIAPKQTWSTRPTKQEAKNNQVTVSSGFEIGSPKRLNLIGRLIYGMSLGEAIQQLKMCRKRAAKRVLDTVYRLEQRGRSFEFSENTLQHQMIIHSATVGRGKILKRIDVKGKGRHGIRKRKYSQITLTLKQPNIQTAFTRTYRKALKLPIPRENKPILCSLDY